MELFPNDFGLSQLIGHFDNGPQNGLHFGIIKVVEFFVAAALSAVGHLDGDPVTVRGSLNQIFSAAHDLVAVKGRSLGHAVNSLETSKQFIKSLLVAGHFGDSWPLIGIYGIPLPEAMGSLTVFM